MTGPLSDEKVALYVDMGNYPATSCVNDDAIALAREVQDYRTRRCDGCKHYTPAPLIGATSGRCGLPDPFDGPVTVDTPTPNEVAFLVDASHACNAWTAKP